MHDFIRHLSFNRQAPYTPLPVAHEPRCCGVLSYNEPPAAAYCPCPSGRTPVHRHSGAISYHSQPSILH